MEFKKNDIVTLYIDDMSSEGEGIGKADGYTLFVKNAVIGDTVEAIITKTKKTYGYARVKTVLKPSPHRVAPRCSIAGPCGGCQLQNMSYEEQLEFKRRKVENHIRRIAHLEDVEVLPTIGMENPWRYRNKAQVPISRDKTGKIVAGFYAGRTHSVIAQEDCLLSPEINKDILSTIVNFMEEFGVLPYEEETGKGLVRHVLIRSGKKTGEIMVCLIVNGRKMPKSDILVERLVQIPGVVSISLNVNTERTNVILGKEMIPLYGNLYITDYIGDVSFRISPQSFFQVNPEQTEKLYSTALEYAGLTGKETVWDLYCGIGTISLFLAQKAGKVYGVEIVPQAIEDAKANAARNGITNAEFYVGKAEEVLPHMYETQNVKADVIVVDPPRKGCDQALLDTILKMAPERVVYVSCDSATLARDLEVLKEVYQVEKVQPVDQFGMTVHVETVVLLGNQKTKPDSHIKLSVDMDEFNKVKNGEK